VGESGLGIDSFETERLVLRLLQPGDVDALLEVHLSNPGYLALTEGSGGEPGRYDRGMLERDLVVAAMTPQRRLLGIFRKPTAELIGALDWMADNPSDGKPWIGLVMIRADQHRAGFATEAIEGLAEQLRARGETVLRAAVIERNAAGRALGERLGFADVSATVVRMPAEQRVIVVERML
jgi:RimJ/RimL family protein N-acetyltransferase